MAGLGIGRLALATGLTLGLGGCEEGAQPFGTFGKAPVTAEAPVRASAPAASAARDVEAPEAFSMTGEGLWDGRPSLGGIWVAHASVKNPERVLIRNPKNGKSVVGALFRRERLNPGPSIQISSDAADALGLLAGQPADLSIVALKREEAPAPVAEVAGETDAGAAPEAAADAATAGGQAAPDPIAASAAAAIAKAEGGPDTTAATAGTEATAGADPQVAAVPDAEGTAEAAAATAAPTWAEKRAQRRAERQAAREARAAERAAAAAAAAGPVVTVTTIPGPGAASGAALPQADIAPPAPLPATDLGRAYVQIGIFSTSANAAKAADQMKAAGLTATLREDQGQGKPYWRVIVGPAASVAERDVLATRVKAIGYPDAYPVEN